MIAHTGDFFEIALKSKLNHEISEKQQIYKLVDTLIKYICDLTSTKKTKTVTHTEEVVCEI